MSKITKPIAKDETLKRIAEALDAKDVTQERISEISDATEMEKNKVLNSIPEDYSALSRKVNGASNALKGVASGEVRILFLVRRIMMCQ